MKSSLTLRGLFVNEIGLCEMDKHQVFFDLLEDAGVNYTVEQNSIVVNGNLSLGLASSGEGNFTSLISLPEDLIVLGNMTLLRCTSLMEIPLGLKVKGFLHINSCTSLTRLPSDLVVGDDLYIYGCKLFPFKVSVGGKIYGEYEIIHNSKRFITED